MEFKKFVIMKLCVLAVVVNVILLFYVAADHEDKCTSIDRSPGRCSYLSDCNLIVDILKSPEAYKTSHSQVLESIRKSGCGYDRNKPLVCCPYPKLPPSTTQSNMKFFSPVKTFQQFLPIKVTVDAAPVKVDLNVNQQTLSKPQLPSQQQPLGQAQVRPQLPVKKNQQQLNHVSHFMSNGNHLNQLNQLPAGKPIIQTNQLPPGKPMTQTIHQPGVVQPEQPPPPPPISNNSNSNNNLQNPQNPQNPQTTSQISQECGVAVTNHFFRGNATELDDFPWNALLEYETFLGYKVIGCGATLISARYVLTAASCVTQLSHPYKSVSVRLGEHDLGTSPDCLPDGDGTDVCADPALIVPVERYVVHPNFIQIGHSRLHDIALLRMAYKVSFTHYVKPVCLPTSPMAFKRYYVSGWGKSFARRGTDLKYMSYLTRQESKVCGQLFEDQVCMAGEACVADMGGALMGIEERSDQSHRITVHGLLSTIHLQGGNCGRGLPGTFAKVYDHVPWIMSIVRE